MLNNEGFGFVENPIDWSNYPAYTWLGYFIKYMLPSQPIPVSVHAWVDGLRTTPPPQVVQNYLILAKIKTNLSHRDKKYAADVSDTLIFDFLLDGNALEFHHPCNLLSLTLVLQSMTELKNIIGFLMPINYYCGTTDCLSIMDQIVDFRAPNYYVVQKHGEQNQRS